MDKEKIKTVRKWPESQNFKKVQAFLRFANFYQRFIQEYSQICTLLTRITKKKKPFHWGCKQEEAFEKLKAKFILALILASFDLGKKIILKTDTSDQVLGLCLSQPDAKKQLHPVTYQLKKFFDLELNYNIHNKKLLAIVNAFKEWQASLKESTHSIVVYSHHKNLSYFTKTKKLN